MIMVVILPQEGGRANTDARGDNALQKGITRDEQLSARQTAIRTSELGIKVSLD